MGSPTDRRGIRRTVAGMDLAALPTWYLPTVFALLGAVFGSFSAVVVDRTVRQEDISGRSGCANCGAPIPWYLNIPLAAWPALRGRAACCGAPIPAYLWLCELASAVGFVAAATFAETWAEAVAWAAYVVFAVVIGGIDAITRLVYLRWVVVFGGAAWLAAAGDAVLSGEPERILSGLAASAAVIVALEAIGMLVRLVLGRPGIGKGDTYIVAVTAGVPALLAGNWIFGVWGFVAGWLLGGLGGVIKAAATPEIREAMRGLWWLRAGAVGVLAGAALGAAVGLSVGIGMYWPSILPMAGAGLLGGVGLGAVHRLFRRSSVGVKMPFGPFLVAGPLLLWIVATLASRGA